MAEATIIVQDRITTIITEVPQPSSVIVVPAVGPQGAQGEPGPTGITSLSAPGGYVITNIRLDENKRIVITYLDEPVE